MLVVQVLEGFFCQLDEEVARVLVVPRVASRYDPPLVMSEVGVHFILEVPVRLPLGHFIDAGGGVEGGSDPGDEVSLDVVEQGVVVVLAATELQEVVARQGTLLREQVDGHVSQTGLEQD